MQLLLEPEKIYHIYNHNGEENLFYNESKYLFSCENTLNIYTLFSKLTPTAYYLITFTY